MMIRKVVPTAARLLLTLAALLLSAHRLNAATLAPAAVESLARVNSFDIPAQALETSLIEFALQANVTVMADNQLLKSQGAPALSGPLRTETALLSLLADSGLEYNYLASANSFVIQPKSPTALQEAVTESENAYAVEEIVVTGVRYPFRFNTITNTQTQGGMSYFDSSRFLNVIPRSLIEDQRPAALGDVLKFASGITPGDGATDTNDDMYIRGYQRHAIYLDGFRLSENSGVKLSPFNTEKVEILKGPATLLFGQAEPGGIVNVIRKKPQDTRFLNLESGAGSLGRQFINLDANGQVFAESDINLRLVLADDQQTEAGDIRDIHTQFVAPSLEWKLTDYTSISASYNYQKDSKTWSRDFTVFQPFDDFPGASLRQVAPQASEAFTTEASLFNADISHYFNADWRLRASYFWQQENRQGVRSSSDTLMKGNILFRPSDLGTESTYIMGAQLMVPVNIRTRFGYDYYSVGNIRSLYDAADTENNKNIALNLEGAFATGSIQHHLTVGADWMRQFIDRQFLIEVRNFFPNKTWDDEAADDAIPEVLNALLSAKPVYHSFEEQAMQLSYNDYGAYIQDSIELTEQWIVSAGTRYTVTEGEYADMRDWYYHPLPEYQKFSSQFGITFKPTAGHSIFVNYSEALRASYHSDEISVQEPVPVESEQFEVGLKSLTNNGKLLSSVAFFSIEKRNIVTTRLIDGYRTLLDRHQQDVRGVEADVTWQVSQSLDVMAALSLIDPEIVSGENAGKVPPMVAKQTASLFGNYKINKLTNINLGIKYVGSRSGYSEGASMVDTLDPEQYQSQQLAELLSLDSFTTVDMALDYKLRWGSIQPVVSLSAKNLLNKHYYTAMLGGYRQNESEGRALVAAIKVGF